MCVLGALFGTLAGVCVPRGVAKGLVVGFGVFCLLLGGALVVTGVYALMVDQPYAIWFPFILTGSILEIVMISLLPAMILLYRKQEERQLEAEGFRRES